MGAGGLKGSSLQFVCSAFSEYYENSVAILPLPSLMEKREFAFLTFDEQMMLRHKGFRNRDELGGFLKDLIPSDAYYSCAYYADPTADMDRKDWLGADLVFDIDADHIPTLCNKIHDEWICVNCGFAGRGLVPEECPICSGQRFDVKTWPCDICLRSAKDETIKLLNMLLDDCGFSEREVHVFFSGHRGYHVHVESELTRTLDAGARKEIVDYVSGLGLEAVFYGLDGKTVRKTHTQELPKLSDSGWGGRIVRSVNDFILKAKQEDFKRIGLKKNVAEALVQNRRTISKNLDHFRLYHAIKGVGPETWRRLIESCMESLGAKVDTVVTTDVHRLIRMTGSLHGKTGLRKVEFPISKIEAFDPFESAVAFKKGTMPVFVLDAPKFELDDQTFGPYKNQKVELPTVAAVLLICKRRAEVAERNV
jgi:DNA primase small subunit